VPLLTAPMRPSASPTPPALPSSPRQPSSMPLPPCCWSGAWVQS